MLKFRFVLIWNHLAAQSPPPAAPSKPSSSSKPAERPAAKEEKKPSTPAPAPAPAAPPPWDDPRAHPSAFLTTRLNPPALWPYPMGKSGSKDGSELWWESGTPLHVYVIPFLLPGSRLSTHW